MKRAVVLAFVMTFGCSEKEPPQEPAAFCGNLQSTTREVARMFDELEEKIGKATTAATQALTQTKLDELDRERVMFDLRDVCTGFSLEPIEDVLSTLDSQRHTYAKWRDDNGYPRGLEFSLLMGETPSALLDGPLVSPTCANISKRAGLPRAPNRESLELLADNVRAMHRNIALKRQLVDLALKQQVLACNEEVNLR